MIPARFAPILFGFILSGMMSFLVAGIATIRTAGFVDGVMELWIASWIASWIFAFPIVLIVAPMTRRMVAKLVRDA